MNTIEIAWTCIDLYEKTDGTIGPHLNVGPTFQRHEDAQTYVDTEDVADYSVVTVTSWIDEWVCGKSAYFLFRTDGIHEVSFVVAEEPTDEQQRLNEGGVSTTLVTEGNVDTLCDG